MIIILLLLAGLVGIAYARESKNVFSVHYAENIEDNYIRAKYVAYEPQIDSSRVNPREKAIQVAKKYGVSWHWLDKTIKCESGYRHTGLYGDRGKAYGIAQFHRRTFDWFKELADMPKLQYKNLDDQLELMGWAFAQGLSSHWTCA